MKYLFLSLSLFLCLFLNSCDNSNSGAYKKGQTIYIKPDSIKVIISSYDGNGRYSAYYFDDNKDMQEIYIYSFEICK